MKNLFLANRVLAFIFFSLFITIQSGHSQNTAPAIKVKHYIPVQPVLKGLPSNPILRVSIAIPDGLSASYSKIATSINKESISSIKDISVYLTGATPFDTTDLIGSVTGNQILPATEFSVRLQLKPGLHFIWFSIRLNENYDADTKIQFSCKSLKEENGKWLLVNSKPSNNYMGSVIRKAMDDGVHTYRIPGLIKTNTNSLIAVYDIRHESNRDLPGNIDVGMSKSTDNGITWQPMKTIMDMGPPHGNNGVGDPSILFDPAQNRIWVAALWSKGNRSSAGSLTGLSPDSTGQFVLTYSDDDGITWAKPYSITPFIKNPAWHVYFNGPGSGIVMKDGTLVFAAQYWDENKIPYSTIIYSKDNGQHWIGKINGPKSNTTESQVVETTPGILMLNMRDNRGGYRSIATTRDMGTHWTEHHTSYQVLKDPVCMASILKAPVTISGIKKDILFFSNVYTVSNRYNMTVSASADLGESWSEANRLLIDERPCYGYSCLTAINSQTIGLIYEGTRDLYFVNIPVKDVVKVK